VFQVNVCTRLEAGFSGDPVELFCAGAERLEPLYGAFLSHRSVAVASFSPELFLRRREERVLSSPIKGTAARKEMAASEGVRLVSSGKDRAENVMIVDLMRNDLGRVCRYGTVAVPELCRLEEHPGVWHLVSDVTGEVSDSVSDADLLRATFPPGSVTGAPKVRAMELVSELEGTAREVYTGAVGIASPLTGLQLNVAIRTFEIADGSAWLGVGGGIVADSDPRQELEECFDKAVPLLAGVGARLGPDHLEPPAGAGPSPRPGFAHVDLASGVFETMLAIDGRLVGLEAHLGRLAASVSCLYGTSLPACLAAALVEAAAARLGPGRLRVRAYPASDHGLVWEASVVPAPEAFSGSPGFCAALVAETVANGFGPHKWHDRRLVAERRARRALSQAEQLLFVDTDGCVLETEHANVFAVCGGVVRTHPLEGRILAGTTRETVIRAAIALGLEVLEEPLSLGELASADEVFLTSSIRGLCRVGELREGRPYADGPIALRLAKALWKAWESGVTSLPPHVSGCSLPM